MNREVVVTARFTGKETGSEKGRVQGHTSGDHQTEVQTLGLSDWEMERVSLSERPPVDASACAFPLQAALGGASDSQLAWISARRAQRSLAAVLGGA